MEKPMDQTTRIEIDNIHSTDKDLQNAAYSAVMEATDKPVDWAYEVWDEMVASLNDKDNHVRAIAAQVLCNLAKSDPENRIIKDFDKLIAVTKDERFVTARHCMQSLWKIGVVGPEQRQTLVNGLEKRFTECLREKNGSLIRSDILQSLRNVYDAVKDDAVKTKALELIETEEDAKYKKKYASLWKKV
jgi:hypothetical protein